MGVYPININFFRWPSSLQNGLHLPQIPNIRFETVQVISTSMAFFHAQIQPHHDHSHSASGSTINDDELDVETAALIAKLALDDLADVMGARKGKARADSLPSDEEIAYRLQSEQYDQWLSFVVDAKLAKSIDGALVTDAAYLDAFITAEEAAAEDRIAAELLSRGEALPAPKGCQTRLEHPNFVMNPELITVYV